MKPKILFWLGLVVGVSLPCYSNGVNDAQAEPWQKELLGAVRVEINVASQTKRSEGLHFRIERETGLGSNDPPATVGRAWLEDDLSGIPIHSQPPQGAGNYEEIHLSPGNGDGWGGVLNLTDACYAKLQPGRQTYHYRYHIEILDRQAAANNSSQAVYERVIEETVPWRLLPENAQPPLPSLRSDPSLEASIRQSMGVCLFRDKRDATLVQVSIGAEHPPTGMAFDLSLKSGPEIWPLGPVAWADGEMGETHFDTDLPENIKEVEVVLTPSAVAAAKLKRDDWFQLIRLNEVWSGPTIVLPHIEVQNQEIVMNKIPPPAALSAREYALEEFEPTDPIVHELRSDGNWVKASVQLQLAVAEHRDDIRALYDLGCVLMANGDFSSSVMAFVGVKRADSSPHLSRQSQRQLRRICAMHLYRAEEKEDSGDMCSLGAAYEHGWGVGEDPQQAKRWYRDAANAGNLAAMGPLANLYEHEFGATVHTAAAHEWYRQQTVIWYRRAAAGGDQAASEWLVTHNLN